MHSPIATAEDLATAGDDRKLWEVVVEWNARGTNGETKKPPPQWYAYLNKLVSTQMRVGGTNGPAHTLASRTTTQGMLIQEGCIRVPSRSLAQTIMLYLKTGIEVEDRQGNLTVIRPDVVNLAEVREIEVVASAQDLENIARMRSVFSHKGRYPVGTLTTHTVTCLEELKTYEIDANAVVNCPGCGALHIRSRRGPATLYADPGGDVVDAWRRLRFATGKFEIPRQGDQPPPLQISPSSQEDKTFLTHLSTAPLLQQIAGMGRGEQMKVLDAVYVARGTWPKERRGGARLEAVSRFLVISGGAFDLVSLLETDDYDLMDVAGLMGVNTAADMMLAYYHRSLETHA